MRYFFIVYALLAVLVISVGGIRGEKFKHTPFRLFPDMDEQDRIDPQSASDFFKDGMGARQPVAETLPQGYEPADLADASSKSFTNNNDYYHTGLLNEDVFGNGLPVEELGLTDENLAAFIKRGKVAFNANCAVCHGISGNGKGVAAGYGIPGVANLQTTALPDGAIYDIIVNGRGGMSAFGYQVDIKDRWAIVAYLRALQYSREVPLDQVKDAFEAGVAAQAK